MPDTFARMRQLVGTTTEWAANDLIIGLGEIAIEKAGGQSKLKVGDGSSRFSALPYASGETAAVAWANITGKPTTFPPSGHTHAQTDITGLIDGSGNIAIELIPDTLKERLDWKGEHTPTGGAQYPAGPVAGDTWGILGPAFTFSTGSLSGKTVSEGAAIVYDAARWHIIAGGGAAAGEFVEVADLTTTSTGPTMAGKVPQLNTNGRLDTTLMNVPGSITYRGTVNVTVAPPAGAVGGDYWLVGTGGVAHAGWTGIAGQTLAVNDMVLWNGATWAYTHATPPASGFLPIDGSLPMAGALALAVYTAGQPAAAHAVRKDYLDTQIGAIADAETSLGFLPLSPANNLSELTDDATARSNLGLTATATTPPTGFIQTSLFTAAKQVPVSTAAGVVGVVPAPSGPNLLLSTSSASEVAWQTDWFLDTAQNLADVPNKAAARANLGVPDLADIILKSTIDAAGDLLVGSAADTVARLARGTTGQLLQSTAGGIAWATVASGGGVVAEATLGAPALTLPFLSLAALQACRTVELSLYMVPTTAASGLLLRMASGGTVTSTSSYTTETIYAVSAGTPAALNVVTTGYQISSSVTASGVFAKVHLLGGAVGLFGSMGVGQVFNYPNVIMQHCFSGPAGDGFQFQFTAGNIAAGSYCRVMGWP